MRDKSFTAETANSTEWGEGGVKGCLNPFGLLIAEEFDFCSLAELKSNSEGEQNKSWLNARG